jgi:hypothetical protein
MRSEGFGQNSTRSAGECLDRPVCRCRLQPIPPSVHGPLNHSTLDRARSNSKRVRHRDLANEGRFWSASFGRTAFDLCHDPSVIVLARVGVVFTAELPPRQVALSGVGDNTAAKVRSGQPASPSCVHDSSRRCGQTRRAFVRCVLRMDTIHKTCDVPQHGASRVWRSQDIPLCPLCGRAHGLFGVLCR